MTAIVRADLKKLLTQNVCVKSLESKKVVIVTADFTTRSDTMLIRYAYGENLIWKTNSNIIPRIGETVILDNIDYANCYRNFKIVNGDKIYTTYRIDELDDVMFTVENVCYIIGEECVVDVTLKDYDYDKIPTNTDFEDYLNNLVKDENE